MATTTHTHPRTTIKEMRNWRGNTYVHYGRGIVHMTITQDPSRIVLGGHWVSRCVSEKRRRNSVSMQRRCSYVLRVQVSEGCAGVPPTFVVSIGCPTYKSSQLHTLGIPYSGIASEAPKCKGSLQKSKVSIRCKGNKITDWRNQGNYKDLKVSQDFLQSRRSSLL